MTTKIITFLIGNPYKPSFVTVTGWGVDLKYISDGLIEGQQWLPLASLYLCGGDMLVKKKVSLKLKKTKHSELGIIKWHMKINIMVSTA